jgi:hypothetical protein
MNRVEKMFRSRPFMSYVVCPRNVAMAGRVVAMPTREIAALASSREKSRERTRRLTTRRHSTRNGDLDALTVTRTSSISSRFVSTSNRE